MDEDEGVVKLQRSTESGSLTVQVIEKVSLSLTCVGFDVKLRVGGVRSTVELYIRILVHMSEEIIQYTRRQI